MGRLPSFPVGGGCVCGAVRYQLTAPSLAVYACHCRDCQRSGSGPYAVYMIVPREAVGQTGGELMRIERKADSGRLVPQIACAACGTRLWNDPPRFPETLVLRAGTLDDSSWARPVVHVWTQRRLPRVELGDDLQFEGQVPSREVYFDAWRDYIAAD